MYLRMGVGLQRCLLDIHRMGGEATPQSLIVNLAKEYCTGTASVKQLAATATLLRNLKTGAEVYLVGTAHVSQKSAAEVRDMIKLVKPETVVMELCPTRLAKLRDSNQSSPGFVQALFSSLGLPGGLQSKLVGAGLSGMYGVLRSFGLEPGAEFRAGIEEADRIGARIVCGDQDQRLTAQRISENLKLSDIMGMMSSTSSLPLDLQEQFKSFTASFEDRIESLKTREAARAMSDTIRKVNPGVAAALIDERDEILAGSLLSMKGRVVGVVGLAHLDGIEKHWTQAMQTPTSASMLS